MRTPAYGIGCTALFLRLKGLKCESFVLPQLALRWMAQACAKPVDAIYACCGRGGGGGNGVVPSRMQRGHARLIVSVVPQTRIVIMRAPPNASAATTRGRQQEASLAQPRVSVWPLLRGLIVKEVSAQRRIVRC